MVIQRWQSVLLLVVAAVMACFTFCSLGQVQLADYSLNFTTIGFQIEGIPTDGAQGGYYMHTWGFFVVSLLSVILPLINIFMYRNLQLQRRVCVIELMLLLAVTATGCGYGYWGFTTATVSWSSLIVAIPLAIIADVMAYNRISADQRTLRAADRIR